jgi:hypothetical protein
MANQLILPPQKFSYKDITDQFPSTGSPKKKVFFQAELRSLAGGDARFGVIAYPSWKDGNKWVVGTKVSGVDHGDPVTIPFAGLLGFANNEVLLSLAKKKKKEPRKGRWNTLMKQVQQSCKKYKQVSKEDIELIFKAKISENPHLEYDVTLDLGGTTLAVATKPSPPAPPES